MTLAIAQDTGIDANQLEEILVHGNLEKLTPAQRLDYYTVTCKSLGLNPLTKPFQYIRLNGKLTLYASREATDQLRRIHGISTQITDTKMIDESYMVTARAYNSEGRQEESVGVVPLTGLRGDAHANALMKAETKAKRRATLSFCGLGMLDESESDTIAGAEVNIVDVDTGEFYQPAPTPRKQAQPPAGKVEVVEAVPVPPQESIAEEIAEETSEPVSNGQPYCDKPEHNVDGQPLAYDAMQNPSTGEYRYAHPYSYVDDNGKPRTGWCVSNIPVPDNMQFDN